MIVRRSTALGIATLAIAGLLCFWAFMIISCYRSGIAGILIGGPLFVLLPMLPGLQQMRKGNPLRAVGAAVLFFPMLFSAYHDDCIRPYAGGGASFSFVAVLMLGFPLAWLGSYLSSKLLGWLDISVDPDY